MSRLECPVCGEVKDNVRHIVCGPCWVKVPAADQADLYALHKSAPNSDDYRIKTTTVIRVLDRARIAALPPSADRGNPTCRACGGRGYTIGSCGSHDCDCTR